MIHGMTTGRTYRGSVSNERRDNHRPEKPRPTLSADTLLFNEALSEGIKAISEDKPWIQVFLKCPMNRWPELYRSLMAAKKTHDL